MKADTHDLRWLGALIGEDVALHELVSESTSALSVTIDTFECLEALSQNCAA